MRSCNSKATAAVHSSVTLVMKYIVPGCMGGPSGCARPSAPVQWNELATGDGQNGVVHVPPTRCESSQQALQLIPEPVYYRDRSDRPSPRHPTKYGGRASATQVQQAEITHWKLAGGTEVEVLNVIDDPSRFPVARDAGRVFRDTQPSTASRSPTSVAQAASTGPTGGTRVSCFGPRSPITTSSRGEPMTRESSPQPCGRRRTRRER